MLLSVGDNNNRHKIITMSMYSVLNELPKFTQQMRAEPGTEPK